MDWLSFHTLGDFLTYATLAILALMLFLALFEPGLAYRITRARAVDLHSREFAHVLAALAAAHMHANTKVEVLTNGEVYYPAELLAISQARLSVNLEAYIFQKGEVAARFVKALAERARAGVKVNVVMDAVGSLTTRRSFFKELTEAGGHVFYYHPLRWYTLPRINNRTHRELIVIDGEVGFIGGSGIADHWMLPHRRLGSKRPWRDTMFRVEGGVVTDLQSAFVENWVESAGDILTGKEFFPFCQSEGRTSAMVVASSPTTGRSTRGRMLYQTLLASARRSIDITTPYFLPDRNARAEMVRAIEERGVAIRIVTPGQHTDHLLTRRSSRRLYGDLLEAGAQIYEYQPTMIHTKCMIVDGLWCVVGTTNFDHRSFGLNDEVNLVACDEALAARLQEDFVRDLAQSRAVTYEQWINRSPVERLTEWFGWLLERQQ